MAVFTPLIVNDISIGFDEKIYATDASEQKGAICITTLPLEVEKILYKGCRTKGAYTRLRASGCGGGARSFDGDAG